MNPKKLFVVFILSLFSLYSYCQKFTTKTNFNCIVDNREFAKKVGFPQTIIGTDISQEFGYTIDSTQELFLGARYLIIMGDNPFKQPLMPLASYTYYKDSIFLRAGIFKRNNSLYPLAVFTDSLYYFRPHTQGLEGRVTKTFYDITWSQSAILDWYVLKNNGENEAFMAGTAGIISYDFLRVKNAFYYNHYADITPSGYKDIQDYGCFINTIGFADTIHKKYTSELHIGHMRTWGRTRPTPTRVAQGFYAEGSIGIPKFTLSGTFYKGNSIQLPLGDALYRSGYYRNLCADFRLFATKNASMRFKFYSHFIGNTVNYSQQIFVKVQL